MPFKNSIASSDEKPAFVSAVSEFSALFIRVETAYLFTWPLASSNVSSSLPATISASALLPVFPASASLISFVNELVSKAFLVPLAARPIPAMPVFSTAPIPPPWRVTSAKVSSEKSTFSSVAAITA